MRILIAVLFTLATQTAHAECREERTIGTDYGQASYNCEVVLNGQNQGCRYGGGNIWYCSCAVGCRQNNNPDYVGPGSHFSRTIGTDFFQARYNCEAVLKGDANNCHPYGGSTGLWSCDCTY